MKLKQGEEEDTPIEQEEIMPTEESVEEEMPMEEEPKGLMARRG